MRFSIIEDTFSANYRYWGSLVSSPYRRGSIWAIQTGIESADLNAVWSDKPLMSSDRITIQEIKRDYLRAGLPFWWWVPPSSQTQSTVKVLESEGFYFVESIPSMLADLMMMPDEEPSDAAVSLSLVKNRQEMNIWEDVSFAGFDFRPETKEQYHRFVSKFNLNDDAPQKFFLASVHGKPVATSLLFLNGSAAGVYFVSTLADHRKKGIGLTLTRATMHYARIAGARYATLQSSPDGLRVYEKTGFKQCSRMAVYSFGAP